MRIPKLRKHSSGQGRVTLNGRTFYCGRYGTKDCQREYERLVGEWIASGGTVLTEQAKTDLRLVEMFLSYVNWARGHYGPASGEFDRIKRIVKLTNQHYGSWPAEKFGYDQFEALRKSLVESGVGRKYANESMNRLVRIFKWAASRELVSPQVPQRLAMIESLKRGRTTAPDPEDVTPVDPDVVEQTLPHLPQVVADMVRFQSLIGCRPGEVCAIQPGMVDRSGDVWEINLVHHKTAHRGKKRVLYVGPRAQEVLSPYLLRPEDQCCFSPTDSERKRLEARHEARITPEKYGNRPGTNRKRKPKRKPQDWYSQSSYRRAVHRACDKAFPAPESLSDEQLTQWQRDHRWSPNQLRHTFGTNVRRTEGIEAARLLLGHSNAAVTTIYAEADKTKAIEAARRIG
jgi:integrase